MGAGDGAETLLKVLDGNVGLVGRLGGGVGVPLGRLRVAVWAASSVLRVQVGGLEHRMHVQGAELRQIPLVVARVRAEVLVRGELRGVDVYGHHHHVRAVLRLAHQRQVPVVEVSHRGHERDATTGDAVRARPTTHVGSVFDHFHDDEGCARIRTGARRARPWDLNRAGPTTDALTPRNPALADGSIMSHKHFLS